jgi:adenylate cyclase
MRHGGLVRTLTLDEFLGESGASAELVARLVEIDAIRPLPDGRYQARDEIVASVASALIGSGISLDDLAWAVGSGRFGLRSLGLVFSEPVPRTAEPYATLAAGLGSDAAHLASIYAALGLPEPEPDAHPREDEARLITAYARLWGLVDPTGQAHVRVARLIGDSTRRMAEGWLDVWDEIAQPGPATQGAPTVGPMANPADPTDPDQNPSIRMADVWRPLVSLVHERQVEATLTARIVAALEHVLDREGRMPERAQRPPAVAFVDLSGFTTLTVERGDEAAAVAAARLLDLADGAVRASGGRVVKQLGDGVLLRLPDSEAAIRTVSAIVEAADVAGLPPAHAGIAAGPVFVRDGDVFGRTVNLASRIADRAAAGEVLVEEGVVVALPRGTATFEPIGRVELKGFPAPVALWRVDAGGGRADAAGGRADASGRRRAGA